MKSITQILCLVAILFSSVPATAKLRGNPTIESIGLFDDNPAHIAITFKDTDEAISSHDCGKKWKSVSKESLPKTLSPLPSEGKIRYHAAGYTLIYSEDGGLTWKNSSPSLFLDGRLSDKMRENKQKFRENFSFWLPEYESWPLPFSISALIIVLSISVVLAKRHEPWLASLLLSLAAYSVIGAALWFGNAYCVNMIYHIQWNFTISHDLMKIYPKWPLGIMFLLCGSPYLAPLTAVICFPLTPLFNSKIVTQSSIGKVLRHAWVLIALAFIMSIPFVFIFGKGSDYFTP